MGKPLLETLNQGAGERAEPLLRPGNTNCGGCGMSIALQMLGRAIGETPVQLVIPACCAIVAAGPFPFSGYGAPVFSCTFGSTAAVAAGLCQVAQINEEPTRVICVAGDGGTGDIGMSPLSAAAERNEDLLYFCYDNEIYGNTGGQRSGATPLGAVTTTTHRGKDVPKKDLVGIMAAHVIPYTATISMAHPEDAQRKMRQALHMKGFRFLHILSPCPTGWKSEPADGIELLRLAVRSGLYPVYEIFDGHRVVINLEPEMSQEALEKYFAGQRRFRKTGIDMAEIRADIDRSWERLRSRAG